MLITGIKRLTLVISSVFILIFVGVLFYQRVAGVPSYSWPERNRTTTTPTPTPIPSPSVDFIEDVPETHHGVFSVSTEDEAYFFLDFGEREGINPSVIPHPFLNDTWIMVAQQGGNAKDKKSVWFSELVCDAVFKEDGGLECIKPPVILPIAATVGDGEKCGGDLGYFALNIGPHDARVFHGPSAPYTIYGSNSAHTCFGQWMQDFRLLVDWGVEFFDGNRLATEIQRPHPYGPIEKNWFVFWDTNEQMYAHYDVAPKRVFAKLEHDGSVGPDLAPFAAGNDDGCLAKYIPSTALDSDLESIHQATNSLSITMCKRSEPSCEVNDENTFILHIFQHKTFYAFHSVYEPYAMLFKRTAPFEIHGISSKPLWIYGRGKLVDSPAPASAAAPVPAPIEHEQLRNHTEMFYVTSLSWKNHGQQYHGYSDDVLFIGFGIEDKNTAAIDIVAEDLIGDIGLCSAS